MKMREPSLLCVLLLCVSLLLTACGTGSASGTGSVPGQSGAPDGNSASREGNASDGSSAASEDDSQGQPEWVYVPRVLEMDNEIVDYERMQLAGDTFCCLSRKREEVDEEQSICRYSLSDEKLTIVPIGWQEEAANREIGVYTFAQDQSLCLIAHVYAADYSQLRRFLCRFDADGKCLFSQEITEQLGGNISISGMAVDGQGRMYIFTYGDGIWLYGEDGSYCGSIAYDSPERVWVMEAACGSDGTLYVCLGREGAPDKNTLAEVDFEGKRITELGNSLPGIIGFCPGTGQGDGPAGEYDFLVYDRRFVYGYDPAAQEQEELFFWLDSDVNGEFVKNFGVLPDGRFYAIVVDWQNDDLGVTLLARTSSEQMAQKENMVLATVTGGSELTAMAVNFNKANEQYHLTVREFDSLNSLYNAALAKEAMDLIDLSGVNVQKLSSQGFFEDLFPYVEQSGEFDRADFVEGILDAYTFDGTLVGIPATFALQTVIGDGTQTGSETGLTLEELFAAADRSTGVHPFDGITKEEMMQYLMMFNEDAFIDWNTGECRFDSAEFKKALEFVNRLPDSVESGSEEASLPTKIQNGEVMFAIADIDRLRALQPYGAMFRDNAACVGFPTVDGSGGHLLLTGNAFAIAAGSGHKEGAWMFIERELIRGNESCYANPLRLISTRFPTLKETLNAKIDDTMEADRQQPSDRYPIKKYEDGWIFQYHAVTWDEINAILDLVREATPAFYVGDDEIIKIIHEEAQAYYSGQKPVDDVVNIIQNRVGLYVSENVGQ